MYTFFLFVSYVSTVTANSMMVVILCVFVTVFLAFARVQDYKYVMTVQETHRLHMSIFAGRPEITLEV